jgi:hypothetical protein
MRIIANENVPGDAVNKRDDWSGIFAVIEADRIRIRPLPNGL